MSFNMEDITVKQIPAEICTNYKLQPNEKLLSISVPTSKHKDDIGLVGILCSPPNSLIPEEKLISDPITLMESPPPTHKLSLILHGKGGHKNYCYQAMLAQELATKLGIYSFRLDFRGCGDSQQNEDESMGRMISQDIEDINLSLDVFSNGASFEEIGINLTTHSIVAHSRGSVAMMRWAIEEQKKLDKGEPNYRFVQNLVNTAGRFNGKLLLDGLKIQASPEGYTLNQYRLGKYQDLVIQTPETADLGSQNLEEMKYINDEIQVLSVYGLHDHIVPIEDSTHFANLLGSRHTLRFINFADHNFYGSQEVTEKNKSRLNPNGYPLNKRNKVNYNYQATEIIIDYLSSANDLARFKTSTDIVYQSPRWREIDGIANFRDIGGWRTKDNKHYVKSGVIFRSANTSNVTETGKKQLNELGIKSIFDFRSYGEFKKAGGLEIKGINVNNIPVFTKTDVSPQSIALRYKHLLTSWYTFKYVYENMLENGSYAFKSVLLFLRDHENVPIIFNCTAGKDRTGVMAMIILLLLGVENHIIAKEYELTTIGLIPNHAQIKKEFFEASNDFKEKFKDSDHFKEFSSLSPDAMFNNLISSKYESMIATIELFNQKFGGVEKYCIDYLGLSKEDLSKIRSNLLTNSSPYPDQNAIWKHRAQSGSLL
ncbi:unnamed protein product [Wickerhamomyces anomalus]